MGWFETPIEYIHKHVQVFRKMIILDNESERAEKRNPLPSLDMLTFQMQYIHSIIYYQKPVKEQDIFPFFNK